MLDSWLRDPVLDEHVPSHEDPPHSLRFPFLRSGVRPDAPCAYVGVTGIAHPREVEPLWFEAAGWQREDFGNRALMLGVLVSGKTLRGESVPNRRYPDLATARNLVRSLSRFSFATVHFNSRLSQPLDEQLAWLVDEIPDVHGIQLNLRWPDVGALSRFRARFPSVSLILQVNHSSLTDVSPSSVRSYVAAYQDVVQHALLDLSGGSGRPLDPEWTTECLLANADLFREAGIVPGIAGGLGPGCEETLAAIRVRCDAQSAGMCFSIDTESRVRVPVSDAIAGEPYQDQLCPRLVLDYLHSVHQAFSA